MKFLKTICALMATALLSCTATAKTDGDNQNSQKSNDMKAVIIYFTHSGNTELAAKNLAAVTGAPMVRLYPEQPYSTEDVDWTTEGARCNREHLDQSLRPAIKPVDVDFAKVDTVFIGFPIWWHEEPAVIRTFLDEYGPQLKGKVLYPFCTSYESPMSEADANLQKGFPNLNWKTGLRLPASKEAIRKWIEE